MGAARHPLTRLLLPAVVGLPVAAGLVATLLEAFGIAPGRPGGGFSLDAWTDLAAWPGLSGSVLLTVRTGLLASVLSLASALLIGLAGGAWMRRVMAPILAIPHAAMAVGIGFLIAPTGWLVRLAGAGPLGIATVGDRFGFAVVAALWVKETAFLLLCVLAALGQADAARSRLVAGSLGYAPFRAGLLVVLPRLWPQLRLPVCAVLAFSLSVTDVAAVLGPQTPPTLAVQILRWSTDPDIARWHVAAAASLLLLGLVLAAFGLLLVAEFLSGRWAGRLTAGGERGHATGAIPAAILAGLLGAGGLGALATLLLWAGAGSWRFPAALPEGWSVAHAAARIADVADAAATTLWLGVASTAAALVMAVAVASTRTSWRSVWIPLLLPQAGFLFGVQIVLVAARLDGTALALVWSHLLFVLPYVLLAIAGPWRAVDARYARAAASLGASPWRAMLRVTLPLLMRPLLAAAAIGFAVSVTLYLPTIFAGAGRVATLATEAVSLASGADRRLLAAAALSQALLPALAFAGVLAVRAR